MSPSELAIICASAFLSVFFLLTVLALLMRLIMIVFPIKKGSADAAVIAAMTTVVQTVHPGTKITRVEEIQ